VGYLPDVTHSLLLSRPDLWICARLCNALRPSRRVYSSTVFSRDDYHGMGHSANLDSSSICSHISSRTQSESNSVRANPRPSPDRSSFIRQSSILSRCRSHNSSPSIFRFIRPFSIGYRTSNWCWDFCCPGRPILAEYLSCKDRGAGICTKKNRTFPSRSPNKS